VNTRGLFGGTFINSPRTVLYMDEQLLAGEAKAATPSLWDRIAFWALLVGFFGGLLFMVPGVAFPLGVGRGFVFSAGIAVSFLAWLFARMKEGRFLFPKSMLLGALALIPASVILSGVFSATPALSFLGVGGESGTVATVALFALAAFLASIFFQSRSRIAYLFGGLMALGGFVFLYEILVVLVQTGIVPAISIPDHLIGSWSDIAIFFGLLLVIALATLETMPLAKPIRTIVWAVFAASLIALIVSNFLLAWIVVGVFALMVFVYALSFGRIGKSSVVPASIPTLSLVVIFLALIFSIFNSFLYTNLVSRGVLLPQRVLEESARPNWQGTLAVTSKALAQDPIFGAGPGRFVSAWVQHRPANVNADRIFWNANFESGIGVIPSFAVTNGAVGIIAWVAFLVIFFFVGFRAMLLSTVDRLQHYLITSSFLGALYLWIFALLYVPTFMMLALAFLFTGVFLASLARAGVIKNYDMSFLTDPRAGFIAVFTLITLFVGTVTGGALLTKRFLSFVYYQNALAGVSAGDVQKAEKNIQSALRLSKLDLYYRDGSTIKIQEARELLATQSSAAAPQFSQVATEILDRASLAVKADPTNYLNHLALARAYAALLPVLSEDQRARSYELAQKSYADARVLNPQTPTIALEEARMELALSNVEGAKKKIIEALVIKSDYTEAIFLFSQIQESEGKLKDAIVSAEAASLLAPQDIGIFFQLGLLKYKDGDYRGAIAAFGRAVDLNPYYANAKYYLGLSYSKVGDRAKAIEQLEGVAALNPDNQAVKDALNRVRGGSAEPEDEPAEEEDTPPVEESRS